MKPYLLTASYVKDDTEIIACQCIVAGEYDHEAQEVAERCPYHEGWRECEAEEILSAKDKDDRSWRLMLIEEVKTHDTV